MSDHIPTLADVCSAIAEGHLTADNDGSVYRVTALELRRYFNKRRSSPDTAFINALTASHIDTGEWSHSHFCAGL